ncbi:MAG TPA: tRNA pseudouridine(13) synthase TruD [Myxococcaceae bacterium]|nr:tRNA pseudouridine(13) synthase TruD [Myxococcaceae bacterium]
MAFPRVTADLPGCGGLLKGAPEDFVVEEIPAYLPCGEGEHLFLWVEKVGRDTPEIASALADALGVSERDVGYAGLKDRQAVTRQFFSVPASAEGKVPTLQLHGARVLEAKRHQNKLRSGHLRGNRFRIRIRDVRDAGAASRVLERLSATGVPNYYGEQRFGRGEDNADLGRRLIRGERLPRAPSPFQRKMYLSAFQSLLFNRALAARVSAGTLSRALLGDVLRKADTGGMFVCEDPSREQPRVDAFEVSPAGPLFGPKMPKAAGAVAEAEEALLREAGVALADFRRGRGEAEGSRRAYRIRLEEVTIDEDGRDLVLAFRLPRGSYATVVLDEVMKPSAD